MPNFYILTLYIFQLFYHKIGFPYPKIISLCILFADRVVNVCKSTDVESLRHCASALANVAIFGGAENQEAMIQRKVPTWLFLLANNIDDTVRYYGCLAIAVLVSNKEMEAAVQKSGTLDLIGKFTRVPSSGLFQQHFFFVEPFVQAHTPADFAITSATHSHGQSSSWLKRLMPVLLSNREEARNLAAFHFCMEAEIKKAQVCVIKSYLSNACNS